MNNYKVTVKSNADTYSSFYVGAANAGKAAEAAEKYIKKTWYSGAREVTAIQKENVIGAIA